VSYGQIRLVDNEEAELIVDSYGSNGSDADYAFVVLIDGVAVGVSAPKARQLVDFIQTKLGDEKPKTKKAPKGAQAYKGNGKHEWESVAYAVERLRVPGGWLYQTYNGDNYEVSKAVTFVPVPEVVGYAV